MAPLETAELPAGCAVRLDGESVAVSDLAARVAATFSGRKPEDRVLFLVAHERMNYEGVVRILDVAKSGVADLRIGLVKAE